MCCIVVKTKFFPRSVGVGVICATGVGVGGGVSPFEDVAVVEFM